MRTRSELAVTTLRSAHQTLRRNVEGLTLEEALDAAGGYRSILGIVKHAASWTHVYHSYAFEAAPKHLRQIAWPRGLRDTVDPTAEYMDEMFAWFEDGCERWIASTGDVPDEHIDEPRPCHWGATAPFFEIVLMVANHWCYHAGEINQILATRRGQAWEYSEEVEENHISTAGHRVRPEWMNDDQAARYEAHLAMRDAELHS